MSYLKTRFGSTAKLASAAALVVAAAAATFVAGLAAVVVRMPEPGLFAPRPAVQASPDGTWGAAWEATARPQDVFPTEALGSIARTVGQVATAALIIAALSILLHAVSRIVTEWRSLAVRCSLGARLRHLLALAGTDLVVLGAVGSVTGLVGAGAAVTVLRASWPVFLTRPAVAGAVVVAALVVTAGAAALAGMVALGLLAPLQRGGVRAVTELHGEHITAPGGRLLLQNAIVVVQLAGLLVAAYATVLILRDGPLATGRADLPYPDSLVVVPVRWEAPEFGDPAARANGYRRLLAAMDRAGVRAGLTSPNAWAGLGKELPLLALCPRCRRGLYFSPINAVTARAAAAGPNTVRPMVGHVRGRDIAAGDTLGAPRVAVLSSAAALQLFPGASAVGQVIHAGLDTTRTYRVIGVAENIAPRGLGTTGQPLSMAYVSALQHPPVAAETTLRADQIERFTGAVTRAFAGGPAPAVGAPRPLEARLAEFGEPLAWFGGIIAALTAAAGLLGVLGVAAVTSQVVNLRRRDIAIRLAVGALPRHIELWLLGKALALTGVGVLVGLSGARWVGWLMRGRPATGFESDFAVLGFLVVCFAPVGLVACWLPARRAAQVQPATVWSDPKS